MRLIGTWRV